MELKHYDYYDFKEFAPKAYAVEDALNDCGDNKKHFKKISALLGDNTITFFMLCIAYWSETAYYDGRNRYAVLMSREIVKAFPIIKELEYDENLVKEAFAFTMSAHRYLQNELYKTIDYYFRENKTQIGKWLDEMEFVLINDKAIPYAKYKAMA